MFGWIRRKTAKEKSERTHRTWSVLSVRVRVLQGVRSVVFLFIGLPQRHGAGITSQPVFRLQYYFSLRANWINDPNGLVYFDGEYHLFHHYNPFGMRWGPMTWGHVLSRHRGSLCKGADLYAKKRLL